MDKGGELMKIKLAMVDTDEKYLSKISSVFNKKYPNEIEIYTFSKRDAFIEYTGCVFDRIIRHY